MIQSKYPSICQNDASINNRNRLLAKINQLQTSKTISSKEAAEAQKIIESIDDKQVITSNDVMRILTCQTTKARSILKIMQINKIIRPIQGKGKGKYILNNILGS